MVFEPILDAVGGLMLEGIGDGLEDLEGGAIDAGIEEAHSSIGNLTVALADDGGDDCAKAGLRVGFLVGDVIGVLASLFDGRNSLVQGGSGDVAGAAQGATAELKIIRLVGYGVLAHAVGQLSVGAR